MHKSKENPNGSFSIGKTWNLDDLSHIEAFTGSQVSPTSREWGGETGFQVTLGKPYFWQAQTDKEKKFFIASLIKIYGKYTGGKTPELSGFDPKELEQVLGAGRRPPPVSVPPARPQLSDRGSSQHSAAQSVSSTPKTSTPVPSVSAAAASTSSLIAPSTRPPLNGTSSPAASFDSRTSRDRSVPRYTQSNQSQDSLAYSFATRSDDASSIPPPPRSRNGMAGPGAFTRFADSREPSEPPSEPLPTPPTQDKMQQGEKTPPERRRPPMDPSRPLDRDLVPPPLSSAASRREPVAPPPRSHERLSPRKVSDQQGPGGPVDRTIPPPPVPVLDKTLSETAAADNASAPSNNSSPSLPVSSVDDSASVPDTPPAVPEDEARPGLGPMIRQKKSKGEIAGAIWKAAAVASAFRPRPGGAGDRLRQMPRGGSDGGPDGITEVVPAPPRPVTPEVPKLPAQADTPKQQTPSKLTTSESSGVPEVKITVPDRTRPTSVEPVPAKDAKKPEEANKGTPRRSVIAGNDAKYLQNLGIDPSLLDERSEEFGKWLDFFGWVPGQEMRSHSMEDMKIDLEREINRTQVGGWIARFQEEDERVDAIKRGIDTAMGECEELDNLLTLYSVELTVSPPNVCDV